MKKEHEILEKYRSALFKNIDDNFYLLKFISIGEESLITRWMVRLFKCEIKNGIDKIIQEAKNETPENDD